MAWHGPKGSCGCCGPLQCRCPANDCTPEGMEDFSSIRVVVLSDDEFVFTRDFEGLLCGSPCTGQVELQEYTYRLTGLSTANGTYDLAYIKLTADPDVWEIADPAEECGWWFFPRIPVTIGWEEGTVYSYPSYCQSGYTVASSGTATATYDTFTGQYVLDVGQVLPVTRFFFSRTAVGAPAIVASATFTPYVCVTGDSTEVCDRGSAMTTNAISSPTLFDLVMPNTCGSVAGPLGFGPQSGSIIAGATHGGQAGTARPFQRNVFGDVTMCEIHWQKLAASLSAYSHTATANRCCGFSFCQDLDETVEWTAFSRSHEILLNV